MRAIASSSTPWRRPAARPTHRWIWGAAALGAAVAAAGVVALTGAVLVATADDVWTSTLATPGWMPARWLLGAGWVAAHVLVALAGWRIVLRAAGTPAVSLWVVQLGAELAWVVVFFGLWLPTAAVGAGAVVALLVATTALLTVRSAPGAAVLLAMDLAWIGYLLAINISVVALN